MASSSPSSRGSRVYHAALLATFVLLTVWSAVAPFDRFTWWLETIPAFVGVSALAAFYPRFRFTSLIYTLVLIHAAILLVGGHYTYARVPAFDWLKEALDLARNHFDRLGHLAQGAIPAMVAREVLVRRSPLKPGRWLFFLVTCFALALSATYELVEWWTSEATGSAANDFFGTQGDPWDTQWDMLMALVGAVMAQLTLARWHDRQLASFQ